MKSPFTDKEMKIVKELRSMTFRKEHFDVLMHFYRCEDTGKQFEDEKLSQLNYNLLINQYRELHNIPFPEEIINIRKKYQLPASKMSEILGLGINNYRQYENGEVPSQSNAKLIRLANDPHEFRKLLNFTNLTKSDKINQQIDRLLAEQKASKQERYLTDYFFDTFTPNSFTGYKTPRLEKFAEMIIFFAEKLKPYKTKLNKLLFYSDFYMYKKSAFSISGIRYKAIPMGPVPNNFNSIYEYLTNVNAFKINYKEFKNGGTGEQFIPNINRKFKKELFSEEELETLNLISDKFRNTSTQEIINKSHEENGWKENKDNMQFIDYKYAFDLKID
jgi:putative zinc finger/helix-turn-helix YgiT family protein